MLIDVITRLAADTGLGLVQQRSQLVKLANIAAREIYQELECSRIYREVSCAVGRNMLVALPSFIGELRGMRQHTTEVLVPLETMSPRYASNTLGYKWKNWRDLGESPVHTLPVSVDSLTFETSLVENAVVSVTGATNIAAREQEDVIVNAASVSTTKLWVPDKIKSITSASVRNADITVKDGSGVEVAVLYNNQLRTRYKLVDVSELFWGRDTANEETIVDILYKEPLIQLNDDTDSFPAGDAYDEAWHARAMHVHFAPMQARKEDAKYYHALSLKFLKNIKDGTEYGEMKKLTFGRNKYMARTAYNGYNPTGIVGEDVFNYQ